MNAMHDGNGEAGGRRRVRRRRTVHFRRSGQVLVIVILAMTVLAGLFFYVYNLGQQVNRRVLVQNAADSAAISGASWMARCMNVVAMNNIAQVRLVSLLLTMDALPLAAEMTVAEETGDKRLADALAKWRSVGSSFTSYERENFFRRGLAELYRQMSEGNPDEDGQYHYDKIQLELLETLEQTFDVVEEKQKEGGYDVKNSTQWRDGWIWQAVLALDEFSQVTAETAGFFSQQNAGLFGTASDVPTAFLVPIAPKFPGSRSTWMAFRPVFMDRIYIRNDVRSVPPVEAHGVSPSNLVEKLQGSDDIPWDARRFGVHGGAIPDFAFPHRIGPFGRVYMWRDHTGTSNGLQWYDPGRETWQTGYNTYGPLENALRTITGQFGTRSHSGSADTSRFEFHLRTLTKVKLAYLFGLDSPQNIQYADEWITDYDEAAEYVEEHKDESPDPVMTTRYYEVTVSSTVRWDDGAHWMKTHQSKQPEDTIEGHPVYTPKRWYSWQLRHPPPEERWQDLANARIQPLNHWRVDERGWHGTNESSNPGGWQKLADYVWIRKRTNSNVKHNYHLNLPPRYWLHKDGTHVLIDPDGEDVESNWKWIPYVIHTVTWRVFGGIELREEVPLSNPGAGSTLATLPAPYLLDTTNELVEWGEFYNIEYGRELNGVWVRPFYYLGVARRSSRAGVWPEGFYPGNPSEMMVGLAQVKVFNNRSWDLWTQDWQCQLRPVADYPGWVAEMDAGIGDVQDQNESLTPEGLEEIVRYLGALDDELADQYLKH